MSILMRVIPALLLSVAFTPAFAETETMLPPIKVLPPTAVPAPDELGIDKSQTITSDGFSIAFPLNWHSRKITEGMISATTTAAALKQASAKIYYGSVPLHASPQQSKQFRALQKNHNVYDYVSKSDVNASAWHSKLTTANLENNITVQQLDVEIGKGKQAVCSFYREYHAPRVELHLTYSQRGSCKSAKSDFDSFSKLLTWN